MAIFPCATKSLCQDPATPFQNFSAEAADREIFIGRSTGFGTFYPPLGSEFLAVGCTTFCISDVSQQEADLCAARNNVDCLSNVWPVETPGVDVFGNPVPIPSNRRVFLNSAQSATVECPDGNPFVYTVAAGRYAAFNQQQADDAALSEAQQKADAFKICISNLTPTQVCANEDYSASVAASGVFLTPGNACWEIIGMLPPGIETDLDNPFVGCQTGSVTLNFFGTPTVPGIYPFAIQVQDDRGNFMVKPVTIKVMAITTTSLPNGQPFVPYDQFVDAAGVTNPIFSLESGELPLGLVLESASGEIHGTPIQPETKDFVIGVTEAGTGITCTKPLQIVITATGINFNDLVWAPPFTDPGNPPGTASATNLGNTFHVIVNGAAPTPGGPASNAVAILAGTFNYNGDQQNCNLHLEVTLLGLTRNIFEVTVNQDGNQILDIFLAAGGPQDYPFTVLVTPGSVIDVLVTAVAATGDSLLPSNSGGWDVTATLTPTLMNCAKPAKVG